MTGYTDEYQSPNQVVEENVDDDELVTHDEETIIRALGFFSLYDVSTKLYVLSDLSDGIAFFEMLSKVAPNYFDTETINYDNTHKTNKFIHSGHLYQLLQNVEAFFAEHLKESIDLEDAHVIVDEVVKHQDAQAITALWEIAMITLVKAEQVQSKMNIEMFDNNVQRFLIELCVRGSGRILETERESPSHENHAQPELDTNHSFISHNELSHTNTSFLSGSSPINNSFSTIPNNESSFLMEKFGHLRLPDAFDVSYSDYNDLRHQLKQSKNREEILESQISLLQQEAEKNHQRHVAVMDEMEKRSREKDLSFTQLQNSLDESTKLNQQLQLTITEHQHTINHLKDELDIAEHQSQQLKQSQEAIHAYKERIQKMGDVQHVVRDLEQQLEDSINRNMSLEVSNRKIPKLENKIHELKEQIVKMENNQDQMRKVTLQMEELTKARDIAILNEQNALQQVEQLKKLRAAENIVQIETDLLSESVAADTYFSNENEKRLKLLEIENNKLKQELDKQQELLLSKPLPVEFNSNASVNEATTNGENEDWETKCKELIKVNKNLCAEKEKLQRYTKDSLDEFQKKYLIALNECKVKLREKQHQIERLERRNVSERDMRKREERLLGCTIYEMGLAIMQKNIQDQNQ